MPYLVSKFLSVTPQFVSLPPTLRYLCASVTCFPARKPSLYALLSAEPMKKEGLGEVATVFFWDATNRASCYGGSRSLAAYFPSPSLVLCLSRVPYFSDSIIVISFLYSFLLSCVSLCYTVLAYTNSRLGRVLHVASSEWRADCYRRRSVGCCDTKVLEAVTDRYQPLYKWQQNNANNGPYNNQRGVIYANNNSI